MPVLVDDVVLLKVLAGQPPAAASTTAVYTTGLWYFRLGQALRPGRTRGALSRRLSELPPERQARVLDLVDELPAAVGLLSLRVLVPVMRQLDPAGRLNLLAAEALASAHVLGASLLVATDAPLLREACRDALVGYEVAID